MFTAVSELVTKLQTDLMTFEQQLLHLVEISRPRLSDQDESQLVEIDNAWISFRLLMSDVHALQFYIDPKGSTEVLRDTWASDVSQVTRKRRMTNVLNAGRGAGTPLVPGQRPNLQQLAPGNGNGEFDNTTSRGLPRSPSQHRSNAATQQRAATTHRTCHRTTHYATTPGRVSTRERNSQARGMRRMNSHH